MALIEIMSKFKIVLAPETKVRIANFMCMYMPLGCFDTVKPVYKTATCEPVLTDLYRVITAALGELLCFR